MGATYAKAACSNDADYDQRRESATSATRGLKVLTQKSEDRDIFISTCNDGPVKGSSQRSFETPFGLKRRSKSLDAGCNRGPSPSLCSSVSRGGSRVERLRRRSRKKSVDSFEGEKGRLTRGVESLEEASKEEEDGEEELPKELTERQKELIKESWKIIEQNVSRIGVVTFMGLFETHPDVQEIFLPFRGLAPEELRSSKQLRSHALRVMGLVEKAVGRLDKPEVLIPIVEECGRNHCGYGAKVEHLDLVGPQFILAIKPTLADHWTEEVEAAWAHFMTSLAYVMKKSMSKKLATG